MHILFFSHYYPPEVNAPATRTYEHCVRWAAAGHEVTVVTCAPNCPDGVVYDGYRNRLRPQVETVDGVRVVRVWTYLAPNAGTVRRITNYVSYMLSAVLASLRLPRPDVIVATSPQFFCGWAGVLTSWLRRRPLVLEIRDIWPESIETVGAIRNRRVLRMLEWLEGRMYLAADQIVAVGDGYRDNILSKVDVAQRIAVITNGVDLQRFEVRAAEVRAAEGRNSNGKQSFICSYVGTIGMAHGLEVVVAAARLLKIQGRRDIRFQLVGDGAARAALESAAQAAEVEELVAFTGRQPKEAVPGILASSDACLIHLRGCELFATVLPSKIFETMAMGRPIIMGVRGPARQIVLDGDAGIPMEPDDPQSLAAAVERLADDPDFARRLGSQARQYVARYYDRDRLAAEYLRLLVRIGEGEVGGRSVSR